MRKQLRSKFIGPFGWQSVQLISSGCVGQILWTDGGRHSTYRNTQPAPVNVTIPRWEWPLRLAQHIITAPSPEIVGLSMNIAEPIWVVEGANRFVDLIDQLIAVNMGTHQLTSVKIGDDLDAAFSGVGALIKTVTVRADNSLKSNGTYTGIR